MSEKHVEGTLYPHTVDQDEIHLLNIWYILYKYRFIISLSVLIFSLSAIALSFLLPRYYAAKVILMPTQMLNSSNGGVSGKLGGIANLAGISFGKTEQGTLTTAMSILKSRFFINSFVEKHSILPILFQEDWDSTNKKWKDDNKPGHEKIYEKFSELYKVSEDTGSPEITISIEWTNPDLAKLWVEFIVTDINVLMKERDHEEARRSLEFLNTRLTEVTIFDMKKILLGLIQTETQKLMLADIRNEYVLETIDPAILPEKPVRPNRVLIVIAGFMLGMLVGLFMAVIRARTHNH